MSILILNNNTIMKNGVVFTIPTEFQPDTDKERAVKESIANGTFEGPDSIEDTIDNMKEKDL